MRAHVSRGSCSCLLAQGSSRAVTCPVALAPTSWLRTAPEPPRVPWLQLLPPGSGQLRSHRVSRGSIPPPLSSEQLRSHHVFRGYSPRLLAQGSSEPATCPVAPAPTYWLRVAPKPPCVPWLQLPPLGSMQLRSCHVSRGGSMGCGLLT
jgi:hypothetical protein